MKMLVFAANTVFLTFLGLGVKFPGWGKNSPSWHKWDRKMCWIQLSISSIQFLCISILETSLYVTMKRRAAISADIFAYLLRYFNLSYKNLTITTIFGQFSNLSEVVGQVAYWHKNHYRTSGHICSKSQRNSSWWLSGRKFNNQQRLLKSKTFP